jgi:hypothetical protein
VMERKGKFMCQHQPGSSSRQLVATPLAGPVFRSPQLLFQPKSQVAGQAYSTPQHQVIQRPNNFLTPTTGNQSVQRTQAAQKPLQSERKCYACGEKGYVANQCPNPCNRLPQIAMSTSGPTRGANSIPVVARQNYVRGKVNHVAVEEASDMVIGMFFINDTSAIVLFDYGASHSFISAAYVEKYNFPIALLRCQMIVSSSGGDMPTRQLCPKVNLKIRGVDIVANLIV